MTPDEVKTRAEAKKASIKKWASILKRLEKLQGDIETMCGFCDLAQYKSENSKPKVFRCKTCEPDAEKLCCAYIMDDRLITNPLIVVYDQTHRLLNQIKALPDVLKEE